MYKNLQYNRIWILYLLFYNPNGTTSSKMKRNHSALQDFLSLTFLDLTWHYSFYPPSTITFLAFFCRYVLTWKYSTFYSVFFSKCTSEQFSTLPFKQQLPWTFCSPHKPKLDLGFSQTLQRTVVPLFPYYNFVFFFKWVKMFKSCN